jgi:hypothetical protein
LEEQLLPWAPGPKDRWLGISVDEVSGRWVRAAQPTTDPDGHGYL